MKSIKIIFLTLLSILVLPLQNMVFAATEQVSSHEISFEQAYELLLENNNAVKAALKAKEVERHRKNASIGYFFPKIGVNTTVAMLDHDIAMRVPMLGALPLQNKNLWEASAGVTWNIFTGGKIIAQNQAARARFEASDEKLNEIKAEIISELVKRYYGLCLAEDILTVRQQIYDSVEMHLKNAIIAEREGIIPKSERLHAEAAFAKADRELKAAKKDLTVANNSLIRLIKAEKVDLDGILLTPTSRLFIYNNELPSLETVKANVLAHNPMLKQSESKQKAMKAKYRAQIAEYSPTVTLGAYNIFSNSELSGLVPRTAFAATANFTVFDGLIRLNNTKAAKTATEQSVFEHADAINTIVTLTERLYCELDKAKEQYESTTKSTADAEESLRVAQISFKEGYSASLAVTDAQSVLSYEKITRLSAMYKFDVILSELLKLQGNPQAITEYINESDTERLQRKE